MKIPSALLIIAAIGVAGWFWIASQPEQQASAQAMVAVTVPQLSAAAEKGREVFEARCSACHGVNASGNEGKGPPLVHIVYEPNHHGDMAFVLAVKNGVRAHHWRFGNMPPMEGVSENQIASIITYVRELQRANGIQ